VTDPLYPEKRIHERSFAHVDTARLVGRLDWLRHHLMAATRDESRDRFRAYVREIVNCERELTRRDVPFVPVTDGEHLKVDVFDVPLCRPFTRADTVHGRAGGA
jgi:hypothetical protein